MKSPHLVSAAALLLVLTACHKNESKTAHEAAATAPKAAETIDPGSVENSIYQNKYLGFRVTFPSDWSVQERAVQQRLAEQGTEVIAGDDSSLKSALKASQSQSQPLFAVFRHPLGTPVPFNPNINAVAENVSDFAGIKSGKDYLFHAKKLLGGSQLKIEFGDQTISTNFGGVEFHGMNGSIKIGTMNIQQTYYATIRRGYALIFVLSRGTEEEAVDLNKILGSLSFE